MTKIIIAQRINSVMDADKIIVLDEGRVAGCGSHGELMESCEAYREIYHSQKDGQEHETEKDRKTGKEVQAEWNRAGRND